MSKLTYEVPYGYRAKVGLIVVGPTSIPPPKSPGCSRTTSRSGKRESTWTRW